MNGNLKDFLTKYSQKGRYPFHMPGHKRASRLLDEMDPFDLDFTEIEGLDNLHHPEEIIKQAMDEATNYYNTKKTWFLVNGSSCGILAAIAATTKIGDTILIGRNCHKAVYHGAMLRNLWVEYVNPYFNKEIGIQGGYSPEDIKQKLEENNSIKVVILTSPTYDGVVSDIKRIAEIVHQHNGILIVDEAHGAHFCLMENEVDAAYKCGADLVIESLHKTLPALTQSALLHLQGNRVKEQMIFKALELFETSSPSYLLMASMDDCLRKMQVNGKKRMKELLGNIEFFKEKTKDLKYIKIPGKEIEGSDGVYYFDETKLILSVLHANISGKELSDILRKKYNLELEMETPTYALALCSIADSREALDKLAKALIEIDGELKLIENEKMVYLYQKTEQKMSIYDASSCDYESVLLEESVGTVSAEFVYFYPPGIPLIVPGEVISKDLVYQIKRAKQQKITVNGLSDYNQEKIRIVKE